MEECVSILRDWLMRMTEVFWEIVLFALLACICTWWCARALRAGETIGVSSHWGGLGGGAAGWRLSPALIALLGAIAAWLFSAVLVVYRIQSQREHVEADRAEAHREQERTDTAARIEREEQHRKEARLDEQARIKREEEHYQQERMDDAKRSINDISADTSVELPGSSGGKKPQQSAPSLVRAGAR